MKSEGKPCKGSPKPDGSRMQAASMSPEICIVVVIGISLPGSRGVKVDALQRVGRQQSWVRYGEYSGHHRGLRAGHVSTGVARELGRSNCFLVGNPGREGVPGDQEPWRFWLASDQQRFLLSCGRHKTWEASKVLGDDSEERRNPRRAVGSLSGS